MAIDTSIYSNIKPIQLENPLAQFGQVAQIQNAQSRNKLADMMLGERERGIQRQNKLLQLTQGLGADATDDQRISALKGGGFFDEADKLEKGMLERQKTGATVNETNQKLFRAQVGFIAADPRPETVEAILADLERATGRSSATARQMFASAGGDPMRISEIAKRIALEIDKQLPKMQTNNVGGATVTQGLDPVTGAARTVSSIANTQSPDSIASAETTRRGQDLSAATQRRGQDMTDARARETIAATGKPPAGYRWSADGAKLEAIPGGPADIKAGELGAKRERQQQGAVDQADRIINKVDQALKKVGFTTTGLVGSVMSKVPGTTARNLSADLETIRANLGFAELQAMRDASPTGGALGQVAVQELVALQSTLASLDQAQDDDQLAARLGEVKGHYERWKRAVEQSRSGSQTPAKPAANPIVPLTFDADKEARYQAWKKQNGK